MKPRLILLIALLSVGPLSAESLLMMYPRETTSKVAIEEFANSLKMLLEEEFKTAVIKKIEDKTGEQFPADLSQYLMIECIPYQSQIKATSTGKHAALIEQEFAKTFIHFRLRAKINKPMKQIESLRVEIDHIRGQLTDKALETNKKISLQSELDAKIEEIKMLRSNMKQDTSPLWRIIARAPMPAPSYRTACINPSPHLT